MPTFDTIPDELLELANEAHSYFDVRGYDIHIEQREVGFPYLPALICKRQTENHIVEILSRNDDSRFRRWIAFAQSQNVDTKISFAIHKSNITIDMIDYFYQYGIGLLSFENGAYRYLSDPRNLAAPSGLPDLRDINPVIRPHIAPALEKFVRGEWRDGLIDAFALIERACKIKLTKGIESGTYTFINRDGHQVNYTVNSIESMTLGQIKTAFNEIQNRTQIDSFIHATISSILAARNKITHGRGNAAAENEVRQGAGNHVHAILSCLEDIHTHEPNFAL